MLKGSCQTFQVLKTKPKPNNCVRNSNPEEHQMPTVYHTPTGLHRNLSKETPVTGDGGCPFQAESYLAKGRGHQHAFQNGPGTDPC